jgi:hypothetical protein
MVRQTSKNTYHEIEANGLLSKARWLVYSSLYTYGPCTAGELFKKMDSMAIKGSVCARLTELRDMAVVAEVGEKTCEFTGQTAIVWDVTKNLPKGIKKEKQATRRELIDSYCKQLEEICDYLEKRPNVPEKWQRWALRSWGLIKQGRKYRVKK